MGATGHPQINSLNELYLSEEQPFRRVHRLIDLMETIIKTHTVVLIGVYFKGSFISEGIKKLFAASLTTPSLGHWQTFSRVLFDELAMNHLTQQHYEALLDQFRTDQQREKLAKIYTWEENQYRLRSYDAISKIKDYRKFVLNGIQSLHHAGRAKWIDHRFAFDHSFFSHFISWDLQTDLVINIRNRYAHGATPSDEECLRDIAALEQLRAEWMDAEWLNHTSIVVQASNESSWMNLEGREAELSHVTQQLASAASSYAPHSPLLISSNGVIIDLFPLLHCLQIMPEWGGSLIFFNDLKKYKSKAVSYLHYPAAKHIQDRDSFGRFIQLFDMEAWRNHKAPGVFDSIIEELNRGGFQGRVRELQWLEEYIRSREQGICIVEGAPGIGKSTLLNQALSSVNEADGYRIIRYYARRNLFSDDRTYLLQYLNDQLQHYFPIQLETGEGEGSLQEQLHLRLTHASRQLGDQKLILFIDGWDEFSELPSRKPSILTPLTYHHVYFIYSTRKASELMNAMPSEHVTLLRLDGFTAGEIRALLYESVSKYEIERESPQIDLILDRSGGNPLFIKLLSKELAEGHTRFSDLHQIGRLIDQFYEAIFSRIRNGSDSSSATNLLFIMAAAKDALSVNDLCHIPGMNLDRVKRGLDTIGELLIEAPIGHYQLFHETLREYLTKHYEKSIQDAHNQLLHYCRSWEQLAAYTSRSQYLYQYFVDHLAATGKWDELIQLAVNEDYVKEQIKQTGTLRYTIRLISIGLQACNTSNRRQDALRIGVHAMKVHNRTSQSMSAVDKGMLLGEPEAVLSMIKEQFHDEKERVVLYFCLLITVISTDECISRKRLLTQTLQHLEETLPESTSINEYMSGHIIYRILVQLYRLGVEREAIHKRLNLQFIIDEVVNGLDRDQVWPHKVCINNGHSATIFARLPVYWKMESETEFNFFIEFHQDLLQGQEEEAYYQLYFGSMEYFKKLSQKKLFNHAFELAVQSWRLLEDGSSKLYNALLLVIAGWREGNVPQDLEHAVKTFDLASFEDSVSEDSDLAEYDEEFHFLLAASLWLINNEDYRSIESFMDNVKHNVYASEYATSYARISARAKQHGLTELWNQMLQQSKFAQEFAAELESIHAYVPPEPPPPNALQLADEIEDEYDRWNQYDSLAEYYAENGRADLVVEILSRILHQDKRIEFLEYNLFLLLHSGSYKEAIECAQLMPTPYHQSDVLAQVASFQASNGEMKLALDTLSKITDADFRGKAIRELSGSYYALGEPDQIIELLLQASELRAYQLDTDSLNLLAITVVETLVEQGQMESAKLLLDIAVTESFHQMGLLLKICDGYIAKNDYNGAFQLISGTWSDDLIMGAIADALVKEYDFDQIQHYISILPPSSNKRAIRSHLDKLYVRHQVEETVATSNRVSHDMIDRLTQSYRQKLQMIKFNKSKEKDALTLFDEGFKSRGGICSMKRLALASKEDSVYWYSFLAERGSKPCAFDYLRNVMLLEIQHVDYEIPIELMGEFVHHKELLGFYMYVQFFKGIIHEATSNHVQMDNVIQLTMFADLAKPSTESYSYHNYAEWLPTIADESERLTITGYYGLVQSGKKSIAQFNDFIASNFFE